jgi:hypothetical protein
MNIAIIGPPGAKKTKLAKKMKDVLEDCVVVDGYVNKLQRDTGLALGPWATWSENYMVAGYRRAAELRLRNSTATNVITVGTILDTMYYCGLASQAEIAARGDADPYGTQLATTAAMSGIGLWFRTDWDYDLAFVMERNKGDDWIVQYSEDIKPLAQSLSIPGLFRYESLEQFDEHIFAQIVEAASNDGQGIRSSGGSSEEGGETTIDLSDVRS